MRKRYLSLIVLISGFVSGQNIPEVLQYSTDDMIGTARYKAMSGAFGALGGDFSAIGLNPAGSAVFAGSEIGFTFGDMSLKNENTYLGTKANNKSSDFNVGQFGVVFTIPTDNQNSEWKKFTLGFNYQTTKNFDANDLKFIGNSSSNLGDYFRHFASGISQQDLILEDLKKGVVIGHNTLSELYADMGFSNNRVALRNALLGHYAGLIAPANGYSIQLLLPSSNQYITSSNYTDFLSGLTTAEQTEINNITDVDKKVSTLREIIADKIINETNYVNNTISPTKQNFEKITEGGIRKYNFNFGTQYGDNLFLGINLNSHTINYTEIKKLQEVYSSGDIASANYTTEKKTTGSGFSFQIGAIAKATANLRLGVSYESPTWYSLENEFHQRLSTNRSIASPNFYPISKYKFRTPSSWTGSIAYVFGKNAILSLDYIYKGYGNIYFRSDYLKAENDIIANELTDTNAIRLGGEYRFVFNQKNSLSLRAGYRYEQSPYKNTKFIGDLNGYSFGIGYAFSGLRFDVSYDVAKQANQYQMYESVLTTPAKIDATRSNLLFTVSMKL